VCRTQLRSSIRSTVPTAGADPFGDDVERGGVIPIDPAVDGGHPSVGWSRSTIIRRVVDFRRRWAEESGDLPRLDREGKPVDGNPLGEAFTDPLANETRCGRGWR
jgi:hypothetical protein